MNHIFLQNQVFDALIRSESRQKTAAECITERAVSGSLMQVVFLHQAHCLLNEVNQPFSHDPTAAYHLSVTAVNMVDTSLQIFNNR